MIKGFVMDDERFKLANKMTNQPRRQKNFLKGAEQILLCGSSTYP